MILELNPENTRYTMRRLVGQIAAPSHLREDARALEDAGLMRFHEWPSGHWQITEKGRAFLAAQD